MKRQPRILAGTAIGLFMASAPLSALPLPHGAEPHFTSAEAVQPLIRVQADCQEGESAEACAARQGGQQDEQPRRKQRREAPAEQAAPQDAAPEPQAEQPRRKQRREAEQAAPQEAAPEPQAEQPRRKQRREAEQAAPQEAAPEPQAEQPRRKQRREAEQAAPQEAAPEPQAEQPRRKKRQEAPVEEAAPQAQPAIEAVPEPQAEQPRRKKRQDAAAQEATPQEQPVIEAAPEPQAEQPKRKPKRDAPVEQAVPADKPAEKTAEPTPEQVPTPAPAPEAVAPEAPSGEAPAQAEQPSEQKPAERPGKKPNRKPTEKPAEPTPQQVPTPVPAPETPAGEAPSQTEQPGEQKPAEQPATGEQKPAEQPATGEQKPAEQPATGEQKPAEQPATGEQKPAEQPATGEQPAEPEQPESGKKPTQQGEAPVNPNEAPLLDSQKETPPPAEAGGKPGKGEKPGRPGKGGQSGEQTARPQPEPVDPGPPPVDDKTATEAAQPADIQAVTAEKGTRNKRGPDQDIRRRPRPEGTEVLREVGDRIIIQVNNQVIVESNDRPRMTRDAQEVYYEDLPRGRTRETIVRPNGNQIITIRNRYGDIVRRSRITPDGHEYVLSYVEDQYHGGMDEWRDPGLDLPPLRLHIPRDEYILDAQYVEDPDAYYDFLEQPPVERVQRLYSVDEVKRSARVRDIARRVDLDTLNFEFGSASISESEIAKLEGVATAMERLLQKNPAETFLIEGHTDAVGSDVANLALSDRRAEAVADALTNVFGIAPENLSTQGYGETYLKVKSQKPERENRRVAIRRITPLVAPVASAR